MSDPKFFGRTGALHPGRSMFNLSFSRTGTCDMGQLIPIMCEYVVPGDMFQIQAEAVLRFQPLVAPLLHEVNVYGHYFFVPFRLLWPENTEGTDGWIPFITRGKSGNVSPAPPLWSPEASDLIVGSLWDFMGLPMTPTTAMEDGYQPDAMIKRAYNAVYNAYYRDENLIDEVDIDQNQILKRAWEADYFTKALPWQQRGTAPSLPISGTTSADWPAVDTTAPQYAVDFSGTSFHPFTANSKQFLENNTVDLSVASTFDISDLRTAFQIQKWMERNARGGVRYTEFLQSHFSVSPRDDRLQRPEYIGGTKSPVIISEVLQTSQSDPAVSPQGNMAGHAISVNGGYCGRYHATEYGYIIGIMSIMPRTMYNQGIERQYLRKTVYDHYFPEFAHLSEQEVYQAELYASDLDTDNGKVFGFQGRYNEMRSKQNQMVSEMRTTFDYWHLGRKFTSAPTLNQTFIDCVPRKDVFAVENVPGILFSWGNKIKAFRPLPVEPVPGLIDHY